MPQLQPFWDAAYDSYGPRSDDSGPYMGALYCANPWDTAKISASQVSGIVSVNVARARHLDIKTLPGSSPFVTPIGYEPLRFTMSVRIWTPKQWAILQPIMWFLLPIQQRTAQRAKANKSSRNTFDIYHPNLATMGIASALCIKLGPMTGAQEKTLTIEFLENRRGKTPVFTVEASQVAAPFNAETLAAQQVQAQNGRTTTFTPTQGPQQKPSQAEVTLTPTP